MTLTLADYAANPKPLVAGIAKTLREDSPFLERMPIEDVGALSIKVIRETGMPAAPSWRKLGNPHATIAAVKPETIEEQAYSVGNFIDFDKALKRDGREKFYDPFTYYTQGVIRSIGRTICDAAINGSPANPDAPVGLRFRIMNDLGAAQSIAAGGGLVSLDISPDSATLAASTLTYFDMLDNLVTAVTGNLNGSGVFLLGNFQAIRRHTQLCRRSNLLTTTKDALNREFPTWGNAVFVDMGRLQDDATQIIGNTELADGSALVGGASTTLYAVKFGKEYFTGWQEYALETSEPELLDDKVTYRSVIDWVMGFALSHPRSVARLCGLEIV